MVTHFRFRIFSSDYLTINFRIPILISASGDPCPQFASLKAESPHVAEQRIINIDRAATLVFSGYNDLVPRTNTESGTSVQMAQITLESIINPHGGADNNSRSPSIMSRISHANSDPERGDTGHPRYNQSNSRSNSFGSPDQSPVDGDQPAGENRAKPRKLFKGRHIQMIAFGNVSMLLTCG